jgi:nucleotide-binding universal stress UspA family protein
MSDKITQFDYLRAVDDFRRARGKARLHQLWAEVTGQSKELLHFDDITRTMRSIGQSSKGLHNIPVDAIVGSVNRYQDFDRDFLPLHDEDKERWARVKAAMTSTTSVGLEPIRVYKIGDAYFVLDGNHRVSIARQMGFEKIEAYVTEIQTQVPLSPEDSPEDIILKSEYNDFLEKTDFAKIVPGVDLELTFPGQYKTLIEHIRVHRYFMGLEKSQEIPWEEAVRHWYDHVYKPVADIIRDQNVFQEFPERTVADLYIWVLDHQTHLQEKLGWSIRPEKAASDLVSQHGKRFMRVVQRLGEKLRSIILPKQLENFSSPGEWHENKKLDRQNLFSEILVATSGSSRSWIALEQGIMIAALENADVRGLVVEKKTKNKHQNKNDLIQAFTERLNQSGISGKLAFAEGSIAETICDRARFNDLVILKLSHPPMLNIFSRLSSGIRMILRSSSRPILFVRDQVSPMENFFLAYDGSPKGKEALYVSAYLAGRYNKQLTVLVVDKNEEKGLKLLSEVEDYLGGCCINAIFHRRSGRISKVILDVAGEQSADLIVMGGYGLSPILEALFGSTVDGVLRETNIPVIVCQ